MKTLQQVYDAGLAHIRAQGKPSISGAVCRYRMPDPDEPAKILKCIVGGMIPNELYNPDWDCDNGTIMAELPDSALEAIFDTTDPVTRVQFNLLHDMQSAHDRAALENAKPRLRPIPFMGDFETNMSAVAENYGLTYTAP